MKHHVERTSPKGQGLPFVGTCRLCGKTGLPASAALEDCENVRGLSAEQAFIETVSPPETDQQKAFEIAWAKRPWTEGESDKDRAWRWWQTGASSISSYPSTGCASANTNPPNLEDKP